MLDRLHVHLAMLKREGRITEWYDRDIKAGDVIDEVIGQHLESSQLFLALVSPDFLDSTYCYETEMKRAIERHERGELRIIPIILEPCDWTRSPLGKFKALPKDGKPISEWSNTNTAFLDVVNELRRLTEPDGNVTEVSAKKLESSEAKKYRVVKQFDELDRAEFRLTSFETIANAFEEWIAELNAVEGLKARFERMDGRSITCMALNRENNNKVGYITVRVGSRDSALAEIYYTFAERAAEGAMNGGFVVESDNYELFLTSRGFGPRGLDNRKLSPKEVAAQLWEELLGQIGVSHA